MSVCQYVRMSICQKATFQLRYENGSCSKYHIVQNGIRMFVNMSVCQYVKMSIFQNANFQLRYQKKSCSECQNNVRKHYVGMSTCRYVNLSVCQYGRMQLLSLGIKRKVGQNVNRMSAVRRDSERE